MINGMINVYKERGYTSHDVVARLRGILGQKKIGHTGTLDPDAEGVLPVCLGTATKLSDMITASRKTYQAVIRLGITTDTQDMSGNVLTEKEVTCSPNEFRQAAASFVGSYDQIPAMYSAIKVGGKKLYQLARAGKTIDRKPRHVSIFRIDVESVDLPLAVMTIHCSKGTYIRTLCHDIGERLGCGACMQALVRTQTGIFTLQDAVRLEEIERLAGADRKALLELIIPVERILGDLAPVYSGSRQTDVLLHNGARLEGRQLSCPGKEPEDGQLFRAYDSSHSFIAVYQYIEAQDSFRNYKMFYRQEELRSK